MKKVLGICLSLFLLIGISSCSQQGAKKDMGATPGKIDKIQFTEAKGYIGKHVIVCGEVFGKSDIGSQILVELGAPLSDPKVVGLEISKRDLDKFPEDLFKTLEICVQGKVHRNPAGGASMSLKDMTQVTNGDGSPFGEVKKKKPTFPQITYDEGILYVWTTANICGSIIDKKHDSGSTILGMGESVFTDGAFDVVIPPADIAKFPSELYVGTDICILGRVVGNPDGSAGVKLTDPKQINVE